MDEALEPESLAPLHATLDALRGRGARRRAAALRRHRHPPRRPAALCRPAHACAGRLVAAARRRPARRLEQALMDAVPGLRVTIQLLPLGMEARATPTGGRRPMKALLQRVREARVDIAGRDRRARSTRACWCCCAPSAATAMRVADRLLAKILKLRIFADDAGKMNRSVQDVGGGLLVVSQFTLAADVSGGNRPELHAGGGARRRPAALRLLRGAGARGASGGGDRRVRRRHAGAPGERRAGDDSAADVS